MILANLTLANFKNIAEAKLEFNDKLNCLLGNNGMGKSNLIDAVHYMCLCKSFTGATDQLLVRSGESFAMMQGRFMRHGALDEISVGIMPGHRKTIKRSGKEYRRLSEHIGHFPAVLVSPADMDLVNGAPEERRRFVDMALAQADARYLDALTRYNEALTTRNRMLRDACMDGALFDAVELSMDAAAAYITTTRHAHIHSIADTHRTYYARIAGEEADDTDITYRHWYNGGHGLPERGALLDVLAQNRDRDRMLRHTSAGPHRDDIEFTLRGMPLRRTGSQGQQKTFTISLRIAQYLFTAGCTGLKPLLLLDDIFDKLDAKRVQTIMEVVSDHNFGQIFITDTNRKHLDEIVGAVAQDASVWQVSNGVFTPDRQ